MRSRPAGAVLGLAVLAATGCAGAHRCVIPEAPLAATAREPLPVHAGVVYADGLPERTEVLRVMNTSWTLPVGAAAMATFNAALPGLFAAASDGRAPQPAHGGAEALVSIDVTDVRVRGGPFRPERAALACSAVLTDRAGAELARASAAVVADGEPAHQIGHYHCDALGSAFSRTLGDCVARLRDALLADPRARAWAGERAAAAPAVAPAAPPPVPAAPPQPEAGTRWHRAWATPRYVGGGFTYGKVSSSAPGIGTQEGRGWDVYFGWDLNRWLDLHFDAGVVGTRVGWTPDPSDAESPAESGHAGIGLLARARPGRLVDPWVALDVAYQGVTWNEYLHGVLGFGLLGSAGVDLRVVRWGAVRLAVSYSTFTARTESSYPQTGPTPGPQDDGAKASMDTLWLSTGWIFDLGPAR